jgi:hypothetical protein
MKYRNVTLGRVEAVWNKLGGEQGVKLFLSGQTEVVPVTDNEYTAVLETACTRLELLEKGGITGIEERDAEGWRLNACTVSPRTSTFRLINLGQEFAREGDAHEMLSVPGFRCAGIDDLLMFGALVEPKETSIVVAATGAYLHGQEWCTFCISYRADKTKGFGSPPFADGYGAQCRFLMVKNS